MADLSRGLPPRYDAIPRRCKANDVGYLTLLLTRIRCILAPRQRELSTMKFVAFDPERTNPSRLRVGLPTSCCLYKQLIPRLSFGGGNSLK
jgi:hypothetical protein